MSFEYWFMFPISIVIATLAMSSGIGGAVFFSPIFLLWLKLEPTIAIGTALLTELFGFGSGLAAYIRSKRIDYRLAFTILTFSIPGAIVGVLLAEHFSSSVLKSIFATGLIFLGYQIFASWRQDEKERTDGEIKSDPGIHSSRLVDRNGNVFEYSIRRKGLGRAFGAIGGMFIGMLSVGLAELEEYNLVVKCRVPSQVAVATSIFVVVCTVFVAVLGHARAFLNSADSTSIDQVMNIAMFSVPGVLIGGQIGPRLGAKLNPDKLKVGIAMLFMLVGAGMLLSLAL